MNFLRRIGAVKHPAAPTSPYFYVPGPVFTEPAMAAIFHSHLALPPQRLLGGGYPVAMQFGGLDRNPLYASDAALIDGIGIQQGVYALPTITNDDGSYEGDN